MSKQATLLQSPIPLFEVGPILKKKNNLKKKPWSVVDVAFNEEVVLISLQIASVSTPYA